jgi:hypothetical protein
VSGDYRVLVTASRDLTDRKLVRQQLFICLGAANALGKRLVVVHGHCPTGGDAFADEWAVEGHTRGVCAMPERHPAKGHPTQDFGDWPGCGPRRNKYMVGQGAAECLAFIGPCTSVRCRRIYAHGSHGATGCSNLAYEAGIEGKAWRLWKS